MEACAAGAHIVMLDNFTSETIGPAAAKVKETYPQVLIEASGVSIIEAIYSRYVDLTSNNCSGNKLNKHARIYASRHRHH